VLASGELLFARDGRHDQEVHGVALFAARLDVSSRRLLEEPVQVLDQVAMLGVHSQFDLSDAGTLVYMPGESAMQPRGMLLRVGRNGTGARFGGEAREYSDPRVSPDGRRLALHLSDEQDDVWIHDLGRGTLTRLTYGPLEDETPAWSPDSQWIAFSGFTSDAASRAVLRRRADGSGAEDVLWTGHDHVHVTDWSPDGKWLLVDLLTVEQRSNIVVIDAARPGQVRPFLATPFAESSGRVSPDGRWLAYQSNESGRNEVYVQAFPAGGGKVLVSSGGGTQPAWSRDGRELFFRSGGELMTAQIAKGEGFNAAPPVVLFKDAFSRPQGEGHTTYDVLPGGDFVFLELTESQFSSQAPLMRTVFNWTEDLKAARRQP
jgi:dipeptidyl aminopeptidase/acylaminoacyl peptidase